MPFAAGEAVSPGGMSSTEFNMAGATGGEIGGGGGTSQWANVLKALGGQGGGQPLGMPNALGASSSGLTQVPPLAEFSQILGILLKTLQGLGGPKKASK